MIPTTPIVRVNADAVVPDISSSYYNIFPLRILPYYVNIKFCAHFLEVSQQSLSLAKYLQNIRVQSRLRISNTVGARRIARFTLYPIEIFIQVRYSSI